MHVRFQDPEATDPAYLLEALVAAARDAQAGGALFAFASRDGIRALFDDIDVRDFLSRASFDLIIGVDSVTDEAALDELIRVTGESPGLTARAFVHSRRTIFHPKLCWFQTATGGRVFVGSGNLTVGGLAGNWEGYADLVLTTAGLAELAASWDTWIAFHDSQLLRLDDPAARGRAAQNVRIQRPRPAAADAQPHEPTALLPLPDDAVVLLAEIPRAANRWKQANFDIRTFRDFFGADPAVSQRLLMWRVRRDGTVEGVEVRPTVSVLSHNYRIELDAASGLDYPTGGDRPIGVFLRLAVRQFRYFLIMPNDAEFHAASALLDWGAGQRVANRMRRHVFDVADVRARWSACPVLLGENEPVDYDEAPPEG